MKWLPLSVTVRHDGLSCIAHEQGPRLIASGKVDLNFSTAEYGTQELACVRVLSCSAAAVRARNAQKQATGSATTSLLCMHPKPAAAAAAAVTGAVAARAPRTSKPAQRMDAGCNGTRQWWPRCHCQNKKISAVATAPSHWRPHAK